MSKKKKKIKKPKVKDREVNLPLAYAGGIIDAIVKAQSFANAVTEKTDEDKQNERGYITDNDSYLRLSRGLNPIGGIKGALNSNYSTKDKFLTAASMLSGFGGLVEGNMERKYNDLAREREDIQKGIAGVLNTMHVDKNIPTMALGGNIEGETLTDLLTKYSEYFSKDSNGFLQKAAFGMDINVDDIKGNKHEQGGTNISNIVEAEKGETKAANTIFSNRLTLDKEDIKKYKLPNNYVNTTIADASKLIAKKFELRENDVLDSNEQNRLLSKLAAIQREKQLELAQQELKKLKRNNPKIYEEMMQRIAASQAKQGQEPAQINPQGQGMGLGNGQGLHLGIARQLGIGQGNPNRPMPKASSGYTIPPLVTGYKKLSSEDQQIIDSYDKNSLRTFYNNYDFTDFDIGGFQSAYLSNKNNYLVGGQDNKLGWDSLAAISNDTELAMKFGLKPKDERYDEPLNIARKEAVIYPSNKTYLSTVSNDANKENSESLNSESNRGNNTEDGSNTNDFGGSYKKTSAFLSGLGDLFDIGRGIYGMLKPEKKPNLLDTPQANAAYLDPTRAIQDIQTQLSGTEDSIENSGIGAGSILASKLALATKGAKAISGVEDAFAAKNADIFNRTNMFNAQQKLRGNMANQQELRYNETINQQERDVSANMVGAGLKGLSEGYMVRKRDQNAQIAHDKDIATLGNLFKYQKDENGNYVVKFDNYGNNSTSADDLSDNVSNQVNNKTSDESSNNNTLNKKRGEIKKEERLFREGLNLSTDYANSNDDEEKSKSFYNYKEAYNSVDDLPKDYRIAGADFTLANNSDYKKILLRASGSIDDTALFDDTKDFNSEWNLNKDYITTQLENNKDFKNKVIKANVEYYKKKESTPFIKGSAAFDTYVSRLAKMYGVSKARIKKLYDEVE